MSPDFACCLLDIDKTSQDSKAMSPVCEQFLSTLKTALLSL